MDICTHLFRRIYCTGCGDHFDVPVSCGNRFCEVCSWQRRKRVVRKCNLLLKSIPEIPSHSIKFITLTIPNSASLHDCAASLIASFRRLRQRSLWLNRCRGGVYFIHVTGRPGDWHVHLHIIAQSRYIPVRSLSRTWSKVSTGRIVHIKAIPASAALKYVTAYSSKIDLSGPDALTAGEQLRGFRMFQPFGTWHDIAASLPKCRYCCPRCGNDSFVIDWTLDSQLRDVPYAQVAFHRSHDPPS